MMPTSRSKSQLSAPFSFQELLLGSFCLNGMYLYGYQCLRVPVPVQCAMRWLIGVVEEAKRHEEELDVNGAERQIPESV